MRDIPYVWVNDHQEARNVHPDQPVILVRIYNSFKFYMRYQGKFYMIDRGPHVYVSDGRTRCRWCIAGVWFTDDSAAWMINNAIALPFTREDFVLYYITWSDVSE